MNKLKELVVIVTFTMVFSSMLMIIIENPHVFAIEYSNEKCGVSFQYQKEWKVENDDYKTESVRSFVTIYPNPDDNTNQIAIKIYDISDYNEKTIEYVSEVFKPDDYLGEIETHILQDDIIQVNGFPAQRLAYSDMFEGSQTYIREINILAYDKVYQISLEAEDGQKFYQYSSVVDEIANSIKISQPTFEGVNC
ncbi:MAG TPA: PsbP-related protein [Nitrososphaeraceae archaeon]